MTQEELLEELWEDNITKDTDFIGTNGKNYKFKYSAFEYCCDEYGKII